jgi:molecular chaperone DnaK
MAKDNRTIGKFKLKGIRKAMAGVPQIEVTFDIDANGILRVSAKDLDTQKEQSITITADDRMSDDEIEQAIRDAQTYASTDSVRREALEVQNEAQQLLAHTQQSLKSGGKEIEKSEKKQVKRDCAELQRRLAKLRLDKVTEGEVAELRSKKEQLEQSSAQIREKYR